MNQATDWTAYYRRPFFLSRFTRRWGARRIVTLLDRFTGGRSGLSFAELGGGNSCLFPAIEEAFHPSCYTIIDSNELGLSLLPSRQNVRTVCMDLLREQSVGLACDVVISIGLIEHFDQAGTRKLIERHFQFSRPGGVVLITFPTLTRRYRIARRIAELSRLWAFPDERPLALGEVLDTFRKYGEVFHTEIGSWTPFTQALVVGRSKS